MKILTQNLGQPHVTDLHSHRVKAQERTYVGLLVIADIATLAIAFTLSYWLRFQTDLPFFEDIRIAHGEHLILAFFLIPTWIIVLALARLYDIQYLLGGTEEYARIFSASSIVLTLLIVFFFLFPVVRISRGWIALAWVSIVSLLIIERFVMRRLGYRLRARGRMMRRTLIIGCDNEGRAIAEQLLSAPTCGAQIVGFVDTRLPAGTRFVENLTVLGSTDDLPRLTEELQIEEVIVSTAALPRDQVISIFQQFALSDDIELRFASGFFELFTTGVHVREIGRVPLVSLKKERPGALEEVTKTLLDYIGAAILFVLSLPFIIAIAIWIKRDSPGPVFYRRRVLGRGGSTFCALKFRTMYHNGDEILAQHPDLEQDLRRNHKLKDDPRVTAAGRFLRRTSLDELPQLLNVLRGQMSLVGPRMITEDEAAKYGKWRLNLLTVKPGITGLWQVSGRSNLSYEERVRLDMYYIRNYTIWLDLQILMQTIPAVFKGIGAY